MIHYLRNMIDVKLKSFWAFWLLIICSYRYWTSYWIVNPCHTEIILISNQYIWIMYIISILLYYYVLFNTVTVQEAEINFCARQGSFLTCVVNTIASEVLVMQVDITLAAISLNKFSCKIPVRAQKICLYSWYIMHVIEIITTPGQNHAIVLVDLWWKCLWEYAEWI